MDLNDPDDVFLLSMALTSEADYLVTGDRVPVCYRSGAQAAPASSLRLLFAPKLFERMLRNPPTSFGIICGCVLACSAEFQLKLHHSDLSGLIFAKRRCVMQTWQMQAAKARFSELVKNAADSGPQEITLHGRSVAVVVSRELFDRLSGNPDSLVDFMQQSPCAGKTTCSLSATPACRARWRFELSGGHQRAV